MKKYRNYIGVFYDQSKNEIYLPLDFPNSEWINKEL